MRTLRISTSLFLPILLASCGGGGNTPDGPPPNGLVPPAYVAVYEELAGELDRLDALVTTAWDGSLHDVAFAAALSPANGNAGIALLHPLIRHRVTECLDAFATMGISTVKIDITYPMLSPAFHDHLASIIPDYTATDDDVLAFYSDVARDIRSRGFGLHVEHSTMLAGYTVTDPTSYFDEIRALGATAARQRYEDERAAEAARIVGAVSPDRLTLLDEPETQNRAFGLVGSTKLYTPEQWEAYVRHAAARCEAAHPEHGTLLGAGMGTWETGYVDRFAAMVELDYVDVHVYPLRTSFTSYVERLLKWTERVRSIDPSKGITVGEAWLYKATTAEVEGGADDLQIYARDVWSFWEPLDQHFLEVLAKVCHHARIDVFAPFWTGYLFAYLEHGSPDLEGLESFELLTRAWQEAAVCIAAGTLSGTGRTYAALAGSGSR